MAAAAATAAAAGAGSVAPVAASLCNAALEVVRLSALVSNYVFLLRDPASGKVAAVDPSEAAPVASELASRGWKLDFILNTHHHFDHTGGNLELKAAFPGLQIVGPRADAARIPGIDVQMGEGDSWRFGSLEVRALDVPGHTRGHVAFWLPKAEAVFTGDTLFVMGCGILFEEGPKTMHASLSKLAALPPETRVFCAHEYTAANAAFAVSVNPTNAALLERKARVDAARAKGEATIPSTLREELATNPFLRPHDPEIRATLGLGPDAADWEVFGAARRAKDGVMGRLVLAFYPVWERLPPSLGRLVGKLF